VRRPASDFGGPKPSAPFWSSVRERSTRTVLASVSMSDGRSAHSSPHRRLVKVASSTSARYRGSMASLSAKTWGTVSTSLSGEDSPPPPLIRHGLRRMAPSSAAVVMIVLSSRYALATVTALTSASSRCLRQRRTWPA
jgi:hypothetical protein